MLPIIIGLVVLIFFTLIGIFIWSTADIPLAVREIAINTRKDKHEGSSYVFLRVMSILVKIFAVILWTGGLFLSFFIVQSKNFFGFLLQ